MRGFNLHIGSINSRNRGYVVLDPDAAAYITAAGYTNNGLKQIIDNFFIVLKATTDFSKISLMQLNLTDSTNNATSLYQCGINAVNPSTYVPTWFNNPTANYSGILYNGINQYMQCGYNPISDAKWGLNNATQMAYYINSTSNYYQLFGRRNTAIASNRNIGLSTRGDIGATNVFLASDINDSTAGVVMNATAGLATSGFIAGCRNNVANTKYYFWRTTQITQTGVVPNGAPNLNLPFGGNTLDGGSTFTFSNIRQQFVLFGGDMTPAQVLAVGALVNTLQGDIDTLFGLTGANARKKY